MLHVLSELCVVRSICEFWFLSCHATRRARWFLVAESIVTVIVPLDGIAWLMRTVLGGTDVPLNPVMRTPLAPTPSAFLSWFLSQKLYVPSEFWTMLLDSIVAKLSVPVRLVVTV